jgi:hypothetical protein
MEKDITKFISKKSHQQNLIDRFSTLVKSVKSKSEIRQLEMSLLRPRPFEKYKGKRPGQTTFKKRCLLLTFNSPDTIKTWGKYFRVNTYLENNTYDLDFLIELFKLMDEGHVEWDDKNKKYTFHGYNPKKSKRKIKRRKK